MDADRLLSDPEYAAVLAQVRAEPWEDTHRLVLADRLDEFGSVPLAHMARFIRTALDRGDGHEPSMRPRATGARG